MCGSDGKTYSNDCVASCSGVTVAHTGECVAECQTNTDCVHYADGVGTCCGACQPAMAPRPAMVQCLLPCMQPITCPCVMGTCVPKATGSSSQ